MLSIEFVDNGTLHDDIVLRFGGWLHRCDSYYFALDPATSGEDSAKVRAILRRLLKQWVEYLRSARRGSTFYLPFDISDQCIGCLRCVCQEDSVVVTRGWSTTEGWTVPPSDIGSFVRSPGDFDAGEEVPASVPREGLISDIERSLVATGE